MPSALVAGSTVGHAGSVNPAVSTFAVIVAGYLIGSVPVAGLVGARFGVELRRSGDRNPGYWNAKVVLGRRAALPIFLGDVAKGAVAAGIGRGISDRWWVGYLAATAAMLGHAWPLFARFRGGRSILTFAGAVCVLAPIPAALAVAACLVVSVVTRSFAWGARLAIFGYPVIQAVFDPRARVAATGGLMTIIGLRFVLAARVGTTPVDSPTNAIVTSTTANPSKATVTSRRSDGERSDRSGPATNSPA